MSTRDTMRELLAALITIEALRDECRKLRQQLEDAEMEARVEAEYRDATRDER